MLSRVITISREFGSGGRTIGKRVAEKLGIPCYDAELIQKIAEVHSAEPSGRWCGGQRPLGGVTAGPN